MSAGTPLASGLYPIIRRSRRPLVIQDDDSGPAPAPPPMTASPIEGETGVSYAKLAPSPKGKHAPAAAKERAN